MKPGYSAPSVDWSIIHSFPQRRFTCGFNLYWWFLDILFKISQNLNDNVIASWRQNLRWDASSPLTVSSQPYRQPHWGSPRDFRLGILHLVCFPIQQQHLKTPLMQSMQHTSQFECVSLKGIHEFILLSHCPPVSILTCSDSLLQKYRNFLFFYRSLISAVNQRLIFFTQRKCICAIWILIL